MNSREQPASEDVRLQVGGTLDSRRHIYIERAEDADALRLLIEGKYVNILISRQMGKSSLMVRVVRELQLRGVRVAVVDLAGDIGESPDADTFYVSLLGIIARDLQVSVSIDLWWREQSSFTVNRRLINFFQTVVLTQISAPVVIFLDEIDSTLRLYYGDIILDKPDRNP